MSQNSPVSQPGVRNQRLTFGERLRFSGELALFGYNCATIVQPEIQRFSATWNESHGSQKRKTLRLTASYAFTDVVAVSPASVWRVLKQAGLLSRWKAKPSRKGTGFEQPLQPHQHWHIDVSYINVCATFYYLCSVLDGYSRFLVHWDLRESMREADIEVVLERAKESYPDARPRIISDNGPQFIAKDFKEFIRVSGMTHVRTSLL